MGRRRDGTTFSKTNNSIKESVGNEENGYPVLELNKMINNKCYQGAQ
jgi:hypothetical protein